MTRCSHPTTSRRTVRERPYSCSVNPHNENRAAHGNIEVEVECSRCGLRRFENINGWHEELGPWGPPVDETIEIPTYKPIRML